MMVSGNYYQCRNVKTMTAGECLKCLEEKNHTRSHPKDPQAELTNIPESVIKLHDNRELMRLASLVGTDAKTPELKLAYYIDKLFQAHQQQLLSELLGELPEKRDQTLNIAGTADEDEKRARFYRDGGYNFALNQVVSVIEQKLKQTNDGGKK